MRVRLLLPDDHFGYGSNLNWSDWKKWCNERNKDPNSLKAEPGTFVLPDYELEFHFSLQYSIPFGVFNVKEKQITDFEDHSKVTLPSFDIFAILKS